MSQMRRLTTDGTFKVAPAFMPGGDEIAFAVHETPNLVSIKAVNLVNGAQRRLHPSLTSHQFDPAFSCDGRLHAFTLSSGSPQLVLVIQETKERKEATFRPRDARAVVRNPSFAPDGKQVIFGMSDHGGYQIASVDLNGKNLTKLTESADLNCWPAVSPDGRRIAFGSSRSGNFQIYVMNADGSNVQRLTNGAGLSMRPAWSPDRDRIAFTSNRAGRYSVFVMESVGSHLRELVTDSERDDYVAWHPDGTQLLTVSERGGHFDLYLHAAPG